MSTVSSYSYWYQTAGRCKSYRYLEKYIKNFYSTDWKMG